MVPMAELTIHELCQVSSKSEKFELFALCRYIFVPPGINGLKVNSYQGRVGSQYTAQQGCIQTTTCR